MKRTLAEIFIAVELFSRRSISFFSKRAVFTFILLSAMFVSHHSYAQKAFTVTWPLTSSEAPTKTGASEVTAKDVHIGSAYRDIQFTAEGLVFSEGTTSEGVAKGGFWVGRQSGRPNATFTAPTRSPEGYETEDMYIEFSVTAGKKKDLIINQISIPIGRVFSGSAPGGLHANIAYSIDGFSSKGSANYILGENKTPVKTADAEGTFSYNEAITVPKGETLSVRFMVWRRNSNNIGNNGSAVRMRLGNDVVISGTTK